MAVRYFSGFEAGAIPSALWTNSGGTATITVATDQKNGGAYSLKLNSTGAFWVLAGPSFTAPTNTDELLFQIAARTDTAPNSADQMYLSLQMGSGTFIDITWTTAGNFQVFRSATAAAKTTSLGTSSGSTAASTNTWYTLSGRIVPHASSGGTVQLYLNGTSILNVTGATTSNGLGTARAMSVYRPVFANANIWLDDVVLLDQTTGLGSTASTVLAGPMKVEAALVPTGDSTANWTHSTGSSNFGVVDELPWSASDYVSTTAFGTRDIYNMTDRSATNIIRAVQAAVMAENPDAGTANLKVGIKSSSSESQSAAAALTSTAAYLYQICETDPATSSTWTNAGLNAAQLTIEAA